MNVLAIRPSVGGRDVAMFDIEIGPHLRLFNLILRESSDGRLRTYSPRAFGKHAASFHPELAQQMTDAAIAALKEHAANGNSSCRRAA
ncbi:hypothetical protein [Rhizobium sp. Rhizsp82]|uniref:hypothetical protein n=1 Tax=Rhizobium sp. Rhizsp82 TaxID=3243057 RepID=UPI0039B5E8EE